MWSLVVATRPTPLPLHFLGLRQALSIGFKTKNGSTPRRWDAIIQGKVRGCFCWQCSSDLAFARLDLPFLRLRASVPAASSLLVSTRLFDSKMCSPAGLPTGSQVIRVPSVRSARDGASSLRLPCRCALRPPPRSPLLELPYRDTSISCAPFCGGGDSGMCLPFSGSPLGLRPPPFSFERRFLQQPDWP